MPRVPLLLAAAILASAATAPPPFPTAEQTRAEFQGICERLRAGRNHFYGEALPKELRARLAQPNPDPASNVDLRVRLLIEEVRLGRIDAAMKLAEEALAIQERAGLDENLRLNLLTMLAFLHLRTAENENCVLRHTAESCVFPIGRGGVHVEPRHSRAAGDLYQQVLARRPDDEVARWLLNLARMTSGDFPDGVPERFRLPLSELTSRVPFPRWRDVAPELGVDARDLAGGAVMDDFDGDGRLDLVTTTSDPCGPMKAFRNDGRGGFENVTKAWGLDAQLGGLYLVQVDYDGDGRLDLLVPRGAWWGEEGRIRRSLLRNDLQRPAKRFVDVTAAAGLAEPAYPSQAVTWADYDGDGDLDLFSGNEGPEVGVNIARSGIPRGHPSQLFRNNGDGTFTDVAARAGVVNDRFAKGAAWGDYDNDGDPDLYVSNIGPNRLYRNNGDGTFADVAPELGVTEPAGVSFATWFFDVDNDGDLDLFVADYGARVRQVFASFFGATILTGHPVLYRNEGGRFVDVSREAGFNRPLLPMGANYGDIDGDGFPDVYLGTGVPDYEGLMPNVMYRNDGGRAFQDVSAAGGFGHLQKGHAIAFGDLDNDGDQDLLEQMGGAFPFDTFHNSLYENPGNGNAWITLRLVGTKANRFGVGARIEVVVREGEKARSVHVLAGSGGSFGASSLQQEIGLGRAKTIESITVRWPGSGTVQTFRNVVPNRVYEVVEGRPKLAPVKLSRLRLGSGESRSGVHARPHPNPLLKERGFRSFYSPSPLGEGARG
jgi:VCBS repeat protein/ASPIC/UnbV protein